MSEIKYAIEIFKEYGYMGLLIAILIAILIGVLKNGALKRFWSYISDKFVITFMKSKAKDLKSVEISITESDVINHDVFNYISLWRYSKVPALQFSTEYRTIVFRKYITIFLKNYKSNLSDFINNKEYKNMNSAQLWTDFLGLMNKTVYDYEKEMEEAGIPKVIIEKMKAKNNDTITLIIDLIEGICNSQFYDSENNYLKIYSILNIILSILENTIANSEATCNSINGQLAGLSFNDGGIIVTEPGNKH